MAHHKNWFNKVHAFKKPGYVEIGDNMLHPIENVGKVSVSMHDGKTKHMVDVLHVPSITKNPISIVKWWTKDCKLNKHGSFVEDFQSSCKLVAKGKQIKRMFTLDANMQTKRVCIVYKQKCNNFLYG